METFGGIVYSLVVNIHQKETRQGEKWSNNESLENDVAFFIIYCQMTWNSGKRFKGSKRENFFSKRKHVK